MSLVTGMLVSLRSRNSRIALTKGGKATVLTKKVGTVCDKLQQQIASCVLEKFCENICLCNRILSPQQVSQILSDLIFGNILLRQNSVAVTKIFTKILQYTRSNFAVTCHHDMLLQLVAWCVPALKVLLRVLHVEISTCIPGPCSRLVFLGDLIVIFGRASPFLSYPGKTLGQLKGEIIRKVKASGGGQKKFHYEKSM